MFRFATYHWTPSAQRRFVEALSETGSVQRACDAVSMSRVSAYRFRKRAEARAFAIGWNAAVLIAQEEHGDALMKYALSPVDYIGVRHPQTGRLHWRNTDPLLGYGKGTGLLHRLDKASEAIKGSDRTRALTAMEGFENFLDLIDRGGTDAELAHFFGGCGGVEKQQFTCNLRQKSASFGIPIVVDSN